VSFIAWLEGMVGFVVTYYTWSFVGPIIKALINAGTAMNLPDVASRMFPYINMLYNYAMLINAALWLLYIILSSTTTEVAPSVYEG
jgi:hypothetical protein